MPPLKRKPDGDWSYFLGSTSGAGVNKAQYPGTFTENFDGSPDCTNDFAVFDLNKAGSSSQPSIVAFNQLYSGPAIAATALGTVSSNSVSAGQTVKVGSLTLTASAPVTASATGTVTKLPAAAGTITITNGSNVLTISTNATAAVAKGTFSAECTPLQQEGIDGRAMLCGSNSTNLEFCTTMGQEYLCDSAAHCATELAALVNSCTAIGEFSLTGTSSGASITVSGAALGTVDNITTTTNDSRFSWNSNTHGTNGTTTCSGSTTATFAVGSSTSTDATNIAAAINLCTSATGVTAMVSGSTVTVTATTTGSNGNNITLSSDGSYFTWSGSSLAGGSDGTNTGTNFSYWSGNAAATTTQVASNIAAGITRNSSTAGATATSSGNTVAVTANSTGTSGNGIGVSTNTTDFTWASSTLLGGSAAGVCGTGSPSVLFAYNAASTPVYTSPVLSEDGTKIAFVEQGATGGTLHVLRWKSGEGTMSAPQSITGVTTSSAWTSCLAGTTSCMFNLRYSSHGNSLSSPYYDYGNDVIYVGEDNGSLWKITGVFNGTPALATGNWASGVVIDSGSKLTGPVYDSVSGNVFVADALSHLKSVTAAGVVNSTTINIGGSTFVDPPIVDSSTGRVFVFGNAYLSTGAVVVQTNTSLGNQVNAFVGALGSINLHDGTFDNNYYNNPSTGYLYVCGNPGGSSANLYKIGFSASGVMNSTAITGPALTSAAEECSPLTEVYNPNTGTDWMFVGQPANCSFGGSSTGCLEALNVTGWQAGTAYAAGQIIVDSNFNIERVTTAGTSGSSTPSWSTGFQATTGDGTVSWTDEGALIGSAVGAEPGGTSAIVVDNVSSSGQASSVYFGTLSATACGTTGGGNVSTCAVKRTQAGLQ